MIIAIDGPAGAGKSTVASRVAEELGLTFLDTGAMYRAVTLVVIERGVAPSDAAGCAAVARALELSFGDDGLVRIDGHQRETDIRSRTVTLTVSQVSAHAGVREAIVARQRELARGLPGVVAEGRDTTTVVFPNADHKFFLIASAAVRARRRAEQEGTPQLFDEILHDIERRDELDSTRAHSPLLRADDAVVVDSNHLSEEEVVAEILRTVRAA